MSLTYPGPEVKGIKPEHVGRHLGLQVRRVLVDQACFLKLWPYAVWHSDAPPTHPSDAALLAVGQACRADGIKVLLTGEGSDELFGGYLWQRSTHERWRSEWLEIFSSQCLQVESISSNSL